VARSSRRPSALTDPRIDTTVLVADGERFARGDALATVSGPARGMLTAERIGLNFTQRMSGIGDAHRRPTSTRSPTRGRIADTRKTTPGLRRFERHAVRSGGGHNHRFSLSDAVMAKDNHLAVLVARHGSVTAALEAALDALPHTTHLEVEIDRLDQLDAVLAATRAGSPAVGTIMLDNFTLEDLRTGVARIAGRRRSKPPAGCRSTRSPRSPRPASTSSRSAP
jgi:nicotinate-nucleotide pyrophosphorylase (carboxylating)